MSGLINQVGAKSGIISGGGGGSVSAGTVTLSGTTGLDYEEGIWTATVSDGTNAMTLSRNEGYYTKVGNIVHVSGYITSTSVGSVSGSIRITGLPFAIVNNDSGFSGGASGFGHGLDITAGYIVSYYPKVGQSYIILQLWNGTGGPSSMQASEWTDDGKLMIGFSYRAA